MQELIARMNAVCDAEPFTTSWYVKDLVTGQEADRAGDMVLPSASTRKTSILMHALSRVHAGALRLDAFSYSHLTAPTDITLNHYVAIGLAITHAD